MGYSKETLLALLDRPIAYHSILARVSASAKAGLFLSQLLYWTNRGRAEDGWIYKKSSQWEDETGLSSDEQRGVIKLLKRLGLIEVTNMRELGLDKFSTTLCFRLDFEALSAAIVAQANRGADPTGRNSPTRTSENPAPDSQTPSPEPENQPSFTTRTTSEITSRKNNNNVTDDTSEDVDVVFPDGSTLSRVPRPLAEPLKFAVENAGAIRKSHSAYAAGVLKKSTPEALIMAFEQAQRRRRDDQEAKARTAEVKAAKAAEAAHIEAESIRNRRNADDRLREVIQSGEDSRRAFCEQLEGIGISTKQLRKELEEFIASGELPGPRLLSLLRQKAIQRS